MRVAECPQCRWVPVVDGSGRRRLEMRWGQRATVLRNGRATTSSA